MRILTMKGKVPVFQKNLHRREVARQAFISADHSHKIRRAILRRSRPSRDNFHRGQWVMYWRNGQGQQKGGWNGPAKVLMVEDKNVIWITHSSRLYRCAPEHLRMLSSREATETIGREQWEIPLTTGTGVFQFTDLSHQLLNDPVAVTTSTNSPNVPQTALPENAAEDPLTHPPHTQAAQLGGENTPPFHGQPDAEPEVMSVPSLESTEPPNPLDGIQVPIPNSDNEEHTESALTVMWEQEYDPWELLPDRLVRHHKEPRYRLFCPTFAPNCPVPLEWLTARRQTEGKFWNHHNWQRNDEWYGNPEVVQNLPLHWFGSTTFFFKPTSFVRTPKAKEG